MKISEITGERAIEVIADIVAPIADIAQDSRAADLFTAKECPKGKTPREFMLGRIKDDLPHLLREHKRAIITILAAINNKTYDEYVAGLTMFSLAAEFLDLISDEAFENLFTSAAQGKDI